MKVKVNFGIPGFTEGQVVDVETDGEGTPLEFKWRRHLEAAEFDNCCETLSAEPQLQLPKMEGVEEVDDD